jgi:hypothetical protein
MTEAEIHAGLRRHFIDRVFDYQVAEVERRVASLADN